MAFTESCGFGISSIRYRRRRDGRARKIRITAGRIVQMVSKVFASTRCREVSLETIREINIYVTKVTTSVTTNIA